MTLRDMVNSLRVSGRYRVEIRGSENCEILTCNTNSQGIEPYLDRKVLDWFPGSAPFKVCDFTVMLSDDDGEA